MFNCVKENGSAVCVCYFTLKIRVLGRIVVSRYPHLSRGRPGFDPPPPPRGAFLFKNEYMFNCVNENGRHVSVGDFKFNI